MLIALIVLDIAAVCVAQRIADAPWDRIGDQWQEAKAQSREGR